MNGMLAAAIAAVVVFVVVLAFALHVGHKQSKQDTLDDEN